MLIADPRSKCFAAATDLLDSHMTDHHGSTERMFLDEGIKKIQSLLESVGFTHASDDQGVSSGGSFAVALFRRNELEIGLIVRSTNALGCPNYSEGRGYAGHDHLLWALGVEDAHLVAGEFLSFRSRTGGDPFDALKADLRDFVIPALEESEVEFRKALSRAVDKGRAELGLPPLEGSV